ncbi:MAG: hypothetical protein A2X89_11395 [Deltaproteobacteria bacterium GWD2_55_8]|nr:MAG: hypothetical protein A2X89_11395 [Deltaproteobacteria bacterium GWD2_55_8]
MKLLNSGFLFSQIRKKTSFFLSLVFRLITFISFYQRATPVAIDGGLAAEYILAQLESFRSKEHELGSNHAFAYR